MSNSLSELRKNRDAAKRKLKVAYALSSHSFEDWQKQIPDVDEAERELRKIELAIGEELRVRHGWKFPALDHKPGSLEAAIDDFLWELRKRER